MSKVYVKKGPANDHILFYLRFTQHPNIFGIMAELSDPRAL